MVNIYIKMIRAEKMTFDDVPLRWREEVVSKYNEQL